MQGTNAAALYVMKSLTLICIWMVGMKHFVSFNIKQTENFCFKDSRVPMFRTEYMYKIVVLCFEGGLSSDALIKICSFQLN